MVGIAAIEVSGGYRVFMLRHNAGAYRGVLSGPSHRTRARLDRLAQMRERLQIGCMRSLCIVHPVLPEISTACRFEFGALDSCG